MTYLVKVVVAVASAVRTSLVFPVQLRGSTMFPTWYSVNNFCAFYKSAYHHHHLYLFFIASITSKETKDTHNQYVEVINYCWFFNNAGFLINTDNVFSV